MENDKTLAKTYYTDKYFFLEMTGPISLVIAYFFSTYNIYNNPNLLGFLNLYGATIIGFCCYLKKNYPTLVLEIFWAGIAIGSLITHNL